MLVTSSIYISILLLLLLLLLLLFYLFIFFDHAKIWQALNVNIF